MSSPIQLVQHKSVLLVHLRWVAYQGIAHCTLTCYIHHIQHTKSMKQLMPCVWRVYTLNILSMHSEMYINH